MRRLLPFALLLVACSKPAETPPPAAKPPATGPKVESPKTPEAMAKAMDVPLYPGATAPDGLSTAPEKRTDGGTRYSLVLATKDTPEKALAWYGDHLRAQSVGGMVAGMSPKGNNVIVTAKVEAERTLVTIKSIAYPK